MSIVTERPSGTPAERPAAELLWVGDGAWVACDPTLGETDPRRVIAYVECRDHAVHVMWVRERRCPTRCRTLRDALAMVSHAVAEPSPEG